MTPKHGSIIRPNALWFRDYQEEAAEWGDFIRNPSVDLFGEAA